MQKIQRFNKVLKSCVLFGDAVLLSSLLWGFGLVLGGRFYSDNSTSLYQRMVLPGLCYLVYSIQSGVILHHPVVHPEQIMIRVLRNMVPFILFSTCFLSLFHSESFRSWLFGLFYATLLIILTCYRFTFRYFLELYREKGRNVRTVVLADSHENMQELYHSVTDDPTSGYRVMGCLEDSPSDYYPEEVAYSGQPKEVIEYLERNSGKIIQLYCSFPFVRSTKIVPIINYCENHLVCFSSVPNVRSYLKRRMYSDLSGNVPILSIRRGPCFPYISPSPRDPFKYSC